MEKKYYYVFRTLELEKSEAFILATSARISLYMGICECVSVFVLLCAYTTLANVCVFIWIFFLNENEEFIMEW